MSSFFPDLSFFKGTYSNPFHDVENKIKALTEPKPDLELNRLLEQFMKEIEATNQISSSIPLATKTLPPTAVTVQQMAPSLFRPEPQHLVIPAPAPIPPQPPVLVQPIADPITSNVAKETAKPTINASIPFISAAAAVLTKTVPLIIPLIPPLLLSIFASHQENLHNLNITFDAMPEEKHYTIELGRKNKRVVSFDLGMQLGKTLENKFPLGERITTIPAVFQKSSLENDNFFLKSLCQHYPFLRFLLWKEQRYLNVVNIIINHYDGNAQLQNGPIKQAFMLSKSEVVNIIHQNSTLCDQTKITGTALEDSKYRKVTVASLRVDDHPSTERLQEFSLPFSEGSNDECYLKINRNL